MKGAFHSGSGASIAYGQSELDPFYNVPILKILGTMYFQGGMTLALKGQGSRRHAEKVSMPRAPRFRGAPLRWLFFETDRSQMLGNPGLCAGTLDLRLAWDSMIGQECSAQEGLANDNKERKGK